MKDPVVTRRSYCIELTVEEMRALLARDTRELELDVAAFRKGAPKGDKHEALVFKLHRIPGVWNVEYDGHFGPNVFYDVNDEDDKPEVHKAVMALVKRWCRTRTKKAA